MGSSNRVRHRNVFALSATWSAFLGSFLRCFIVHCKHSSYGELDGQRTKDLDQGYPNAHRHNNFYVRVHEGQIF